MGGVYSNIRNYSPWVDYFSSFPFSSAWVMVTTTNQQNYAQVGWYKEDYLSSPAIYRVFAEWTTQLNNLDSAVQVLSTYSPTVGVWDYYTVLYNNTPGKFTFRHEGVDLITPVTAAFIPTQGQSLAETHSRKSQMAGGYNSSSHEQLSDVRIWYNNGWKVFNGTRGVTEPGIHEASIWSTTRVDTWDKACAN